MFGYRHAFHAGNFADVLKHAVLVELLNYLKQKDKPFWVLDTHAGIGHYSLKSEQALKTLESEDGIQKIRQNPSEILRSYLDAVNSSFIQMSSQSRIYRELNTQQDEYYPGSPQLILNALRVDDRLLACELNVIDCSILKGYFRRHERVSIHLRDGFEAIRAFCPPKIKRGLVFIDPPYEDKNDFMYILDAIKYCQKHWNTGIIAIWYPILGANYHWELLDAMVTNNIKSALQIELQITNNDINMGMSGCGMLIINTPYQFDIWATQLLEDLLPRFKKSQDACIKVKWLTSQ